MSKKNYESPLMQMICLSAQDVIANSKPFFGEADRLNKSW